ncbi:LysM peptidoglycan-binding domain-containing protein [Paenibacillus barcinonensis]|uniref:LysM domain-containing protein n=1 Tax=Paenibacillus barcinonensis TaxID=198119 RepID=A0A2V4V9C1_PAEBA|nr:LysM peptidoglycan-binding domain-containing protein [Paenibacillus barcinonensis]PYE49261.1 LysM domain-containing protein [Paenibacillus barcinonensis]QKS55492.1 LysM peptidoglycan-binding domain-containing protein [Paenibacillus barcinonensis]
MRYSTYQSIYEPVNSEAVKSNIGQLSAFITRFKLSSGLIKLAIASLIIFIGCSTVLTVFAGNESDLLPGGKIAVSQGETLWSISLEHKPATMDTRVYIEAIKKVNHLESTTIQTGQVLILPQFAK